GGLVVEQQVVVAKVRAADVPMEVLGLQIERVARSQEAVQRLRQRFDGGIVEIGRGIERGGRLGARLELRHFAHGITSCCVEFLKAYGGPSRAESASRQRSRHRSVPRE